MSDYIERQAVIDTVKKNFKYLPGYMNATINYIKELPPANVVPVVHGEWIHMGCGIFECDKCGKRISTNVYVREEASERFKYCPNCGAKMDAQGEE